MARANAPITVNVGAANLFISYLLASGAAVPLVPCTLNPRGPVWRNYGGGVGLFWISSAKLMSCGPLLSYPSRPGQRPSPVLPGPTRARAPTRWDGPLPVDKLPPPTLPHRVPGDGLDELHLSHLLVGGYPLLYVGHQLIRPRLSPGDEDDVGLGHLPTRRILFGDYAGIQHCWVLPQHLLQLRRGYGVALVFDDVLLAVEDVDVALLVGPDDVAGAEPPVGGKGLLGGLRIAPVALEDAGPFQEKLPFLPRPHLLTGIHVYDLL